MESDGERRYVSHAVLAMGGLVVVRRLYVMFSGTGEKGIMRRTATGAEEGGKCHDPCGGNVTFHNDNYCDSGIEDTGKYQEYKTDGDGWAMKGKSHKCTDGKCYCENGVCELKKTTGKRVGLTVGWKCLTGPDGFEKCVWVRE